MSTNPPLDHRAVAKAARALLDFYYTPQPGHLVERRQARCFERLAKAMNYIPPPPPVEDPNFRPF